MVWVKSKFAGIRYRNHPTRKHGAIPDRYYTIFYKLDGKMIQEALGWASESWTETKAAAILADLKKNHSTGMGPRTLKEKRAEQQAAEAIRKAEGITVSEFWEQDYLIFLQTRIKPESHKKEIGHYKLRIKPQLGQRPLKSILPIDIERMVTQMRHEGLSPRTQQYAVGTFFRIWKLAARRKIVKTGDNPALGITLERVNNTRLRVISPQELKDIFANIAANDSFAYEITLFCAYTGCRFSEAANLTWEYVDLSREAALFHHTKNKDSREVYLSSELIALLKRKGQGIAGQHVFAKKNGSPYTDPPSAFTTAVRDLNLNQNRLPHDRITFHSLRHTAATIAARHGTPVKDMQVVFGWKTPSMVFRYAKGNEDLQRQAMKGLAHVLSEDSNKTIPLTEAK